MPTSAVLSVLQQRGQYGPTLREHAVDDLPLFRLGNLAHPDTDEALSLKDYLAQQFEQPIFVPGVGDTAYAVELHAPDGNLATQVKGVEGFVFRDVSTGAMHSPEDRYRLLATEPLPAFLVCGQLLLGVSVDGSSVVGDPVLFVVQAPMVPPRGDLAMAATVWPDSPSLAPIGWKPPPDPLAIIGCSAG